MSTENKAPIYGLGDPSPREFVSMSGLNVRVYIDNEAFPEAIGVWFLNKDRGEFRFCCYDGPPDKFKSRLSGLRHLNLKGVSNKSVAINWFDDNVFFVWSELKWAVTVDDLVVESTVPFIVDL